jgi:hypothetical protein
MDYLLINTQELSALMELPLNQRVIYLMGIRPYMDKSTCVVGIKRRISYQSLREVLYVAPIAGVQTTSHSLQQVRRAVKSLERAGLISIQSTEKQLILKCLFATENRSVSNKADMRPTSEADTKLSCQNVVASSDNENTYHQADNQFLSQADTPLKDNYIIFLSQQFELFWQRYPQKKAKQKAWETFHQLQPNAELTHRIHNALQTQIELTKQQQSQGLWVPPWKYPANWLAQQCWEDAPSMEITSEIKNGKHASTAQKRKPTRDPFLPPCDIDNETTLNNVIQLKHYF